jgi:rRNA maturation protein Nop10
VIKNAAANDRARPMELINCHDCERSVSFTAASCPHCGSVEPAGPYRFNRKEARRYRIEEKNDRTLILVTMGLGVVGAFYGVDTSSSALGALIAGLSYAFLGVVIGAPLAFAINITRNWR